MQFRTNKYGKKYPIFNKKIRLKAYEYEYITSEIEKFGNYEQKKIDKLNRKYIGDYAYYYVYRGFKNCEFYGKIKIEGREEIIDLVNEYIKEANKNVFW